MYQNLGIHWASSIPAFLALMCVPFPFLFYKYGASIRRRCHFSREAADRMLQIKGRDMVSENSSGDGVPRRAESEEVDEEKRETTGDVDKDLEKEHGLEREHETTDYDHKDKDLEKGKI